MTCISASHAWAGTVQTARFSNRSCLNGTSRPAVSTTVPAGQAMTMQACESGMLHVSQGRLWVTFSNADRDFRVQAGDHFLQCGDSMALAAGQTVVMEPWLGAAPGTKSPAAPACIRWEAAAPRRLSARLRDALGLAA